MQLELIYTGLMVFALKDAVVSNHCDPKSTGDGQVQVLMLSGTAGMPHRPRLVVDTTDIKWHDVGNNLHTSEPDEVLPALDGNRQLAVWNLEGQTLEVENMPKVALVTGKRSSGTEGRKWGDEAPGTLDKSKDFSWIADLQEGCKDGLQVKHACVTGNTDCPGLSARTAFTYNMASTTGKLFPYWFAADPTIDVVYQFPDGAGDPDKEKHAQALADGARITATFPMSATSIKVKLTSFDGTQTRTIYLEEGGDSVARAWISDAPAMGGMPSSRLTHFRAYYDVLQEDNDCRFPKKKGTAVSTVVKCAICSTCGL